MPSFDETQATLDAVFGGNLEYSSHAANAFTAPRTPTVLERVFVKNLPRTALLTAAASYAVLAGRIAQR